MMSRPRIGQTVQCWYAKKTRTHRPLHGRIGTVEIVASGPGPRNHGVRVDGLMHVIPAGNLRLPPDGDDLPEAAR